MDKKALSEPVVLERRGRPVDVVMAVEEFERLKVMESEHWAELTLLPLSSQTSTILK